MLLPPAPRAHRDRNHPNPERHEDSREHRGPRGPCVAVGAGSGACGGLQRVTERLPEILGGPRKPEPDRTPLHSVARRALPEARPLPSRVELPSLLAPLVGKSSVHRVVELPEPHLRGQVRSRFGFGSESAGEVGRNRLRQHSQDVHEMTQAGAMSMAARGGDTRERGLALAP